MDNGEKEKVVVNSFKEIVKQTSRRKSTPQSSKSRNTIANIAPKPNTDEALALSAEELTPFALIPPNEAKLLMHFLDIVFPLQYPMYEPEVFKGGRGWMLELVLGMKPLYHAALALSAYHRRTSITGNATSQGFSTTTLVDQEQHLEMAIKVVNQFAFSSCPNVARGRLGIMACIVELFFYEVLSHLNICRSGLCC